MENDSFKVELKFINLNDTKEYKLQYSEDNKEITHKITKPELNIIIKNKDFKFKITYENIEKNYYTSLLSNYNNEIAINLNNNEKGCDIEFILKNVKGKYFKYLYIIYNEIRYNFQTEYNNLNLSRILLFNIPLEFNIYLADKIKKIKPKFFIKNLKVIKPKKEEAINILGKKRSFNIEKENTKIDKPLKESGENEEEFEKEICEESSNEDENENDEKIEYSLNNNNNKYEYLRFCIKDDYYITLTIHNMHDDNITIDNNNNYNIDQISLNNYINDGIKDINKLKNILNTKSFNDLKNEANNLLNKYNEINYDQFIQFSLLDKDYFLEKHYLLSLKSFFSYLIVIIIDIIIRLINLYNSSKSALDNKKKEKIIKEILINVLNKYDLFKHYYDYFNPFNINKKNIDNLILFKDNLSFKEKANYLSCILTILLISPKTDNNNIIEFFEIKDNKNDIYSKVKQFIFNIIDKLSNKSAYINGLELITSRIKEDLNENNGIKYYQKDSKNTFILEARTIEELKETIKNFFPKLIVRTFNSQSRFNALIDNYSGLMIINENIYEQDSLIKIKGDYDDNKAFKKLDNIIKGSIDLKDDKINEQYHLFIFKAFWRINHECFGHLPVLEINNKKIERSMNFISNGHFINSDNAGQILEYFFNIDGKIINSIKNMNYNALNLLKDELYIGKNFNSLLENFIDLKNKNAFKDSEINTSLEDDFLIEIINEYDNIIKLKGEERKIIKSGKKTEFHFKKRFKS